MANERILFIEDDKDLRKIVHDFLVKENYEVVLACNGVEGIESAKKYQPTLILLDLMLPKVDGFEVCREIRRESMVPIMILSAKSSDMDKMLSLGIGADDYLTKPFSMLELEARIKSHIRRYIAFSQMPATDSSVRSIGEVEIDTAAYRVTVCGQNVELTTKEFKLLDFLSQNPSQVFSKEQLLDRVWGESEFVDSNTITVYIGRIREKMSRAGACYIKTVWGAGYKWEI
jgi:DNA-binding response OmpR family regulator